MLEKFSCTHFWDHCMNVMTSHRVALTPVLAFYAVNEHLAGWECLATQFSRAGCQLLFRYVQEVILSMSLSVTRATNLRTNVVCCPLLSDCRLYLSRARSVMFCCVYTCSNRCVTNSVVVKLHKRWSGFAVVLRLTACVKSLMCNFEKPSPWPSPSYASPQAPCLLLRYSFLW